VRILVIEDTPELAELLDIVLRANGHTIYTAADGPRGLHLAQLHVPDLILVDVQLPGIDGFEVLQRLRRDARLAECRIVALTACAARGDRERILAAGFTGYIAKPIRPQQLAEEVAQYCVAAT
jgi:two-component system cell cycle response regulator